MKLKIKCKRCKEEFKIPVSSMKEIRKLKRSQYYVCEECSEKGIDLKTVLNVVKGLKVDITEMFDIKK